MKIRRTPTPTPPPAPVTAVTTPPRTGAAHPVHARHPYLTGSRWAVYCPWCTRGRRLPDGTLATTDSPHTRQVPCEECTARP